MAAKKRLSVAEEIEWLAEVTEDGSDVSITADFAKRLVKYMRYLRTRAAPQKRKVKKYRDGSDSLWNTQNDRWERETTDRWR